MLLQIAVRLLVEVIMTTLVIVDVPAANKNLLGPPSGKTKPDSISNGIRDNLTLEVFCSSLDVSFSL